MGTLEWILAAVAVIAGAAIAFVVALPRIIQTLVWLVLFPRYRLRIRGLEHLPRTGPVLLVSNHVSWLDGFVMAASCPRRGRVLINGDFVRLPVLGSLARRAGMI